MWPGLCMTSFYFIACQKITPIHFQYDCDLGLGFWLCAFIIQLVSSLSSTRVGLVLSCYIQSKTSFNVWFGSLSCCNTHSCHSFNSLVQSFDSQKGENWPTMIKVNPGTVTTVKFGTNILSNMLNCSHHWAWWWECHAVGLFHCAFYMVYGIIKLDMLF